MSIAFYIDHLTEDTISNPKHWPKINPKNFKHSEKDSKFGIIADIFVTLYKREKKPNAILTTF